MSLHSWLHNLRSALAPRQGSLQTATHRPNLEVLEDRWLPSFSPTTSFPVGTTPVAVVTADFNNDGSLDLATANSDGGSVSVLLGDGQGGFAPAPQIAAGFGPSALAVGDVNNDGKLDLVIANSVVSVRLGNGDGTFQLPIDTAPLSGETPISVALADFNADGQMDLVATSGSALDDGAGYIDVMLGDGSGLFGGNYTYGGWGGPVVQSVADLNADGMPDMIMTDPGLMFDFGAGVWLSGDGLLQYAGTTGGAVWAATVGDFTGDGIADLVTAGPTVDVRPGNGDGTFASPIHTNVNGTGQTALAAADFNGDGELDIVTTGGGAVNALLGSGNGTFTPSLVYTVDSSRTEFAVGDFNGDGRTDVAVANATSNTVSVLLNDGAWSLSAPRLQIGDAIVTEGNTGTVAATLTVTLSTASTQPVTVTYTTANGTATAGSDYQATSGTLTFAPGQTSKTITVLVNGDRLPEPNETFVVKLSSPTNATIAEGQGVGTILDDEPRISISDVTKYEGTANGNAKKTTQFTFTVTLSAAYDQPVTMAYRTVDGTATTSDNDYVAQTGTLTFKPGETSKTITIVVNGDNKKEANEAFYLDLFGLSSNALFTRNRGLGTILNDD
jgi:hypothetical protein